MFQAMMESFVGTPHAGFRADVLRAFSSEHPAIPARWLYDYRGSQLFEAITKLPEYYPTRVEHEILERYSAQLAQLVGSGSTLVEFGSGSSAKTPILLRALRSSRYVAVDISASFLRESLDRIASTFPDLEVVGVEADFSAKLDLELETSGPIVGFFPGSTIGNWEPEAAVDILRAMRGTLGDGGRLVLGVDRRKDVSTLVRAYNDRQGVTARFNLNLLDRINRELRGTIPTARFEHIAQWNERHGRIEMHLRATQDMAFEIEGTTFWMKADQRIHTENSYKYDTREADLLLRAAGWLPIEIWEDAAGMFSVLVSRAAARVVAP
jgi:dimethylhistidine N-methyltransferase